MRCSAKKKAMYTAIEKVAAPFYDKIICISDAEKQSALGKKICKDDKLQVIFNVVDIDAYENGVHDTVKRKKLNIPEDAFVVGMVGRMSPQKAPDVFVKMAKRVKDIKKYPSLKKAAECRYFSTVCNILFQIHSPEFKKQEKELWREIKKYRYSVMTNRNGRKKARIAAFLSYGGYKFLYTIYVRTQKTIRK